MISFPNQRSSRSSFFAQVAHQIPILPLKQRLKISSTFFSAGTFLVAPFFFSPQEQIYSAAFISIRTFLWDFKNSSPSGVQKTIFPQQWPPSPRFPWYIPFLSSSFAPFLPWFLRFLITVILFFLEFKKQHSYPNGRTTQYDLFRPHGWSRSNRFHKPGNQQNPLQNRQHESRLVTSIQIMAKFDS